MLYWRRWASAGAAGDSRSREQPHVPGRGATRTGRARPLLAARRALTEFKDAQATFSLQEYASRAEDHLGAGDRSGKDGRPGWPASCTSTPTITRRFRASSRRTVGTAVARSAPQRARGAARQGETARRSPAPAEGRRGELHRRHQGPRRGPHPGTSKVTDIRVVSPCSFERIPRSPCACTTWRWASWRRC